MTGGNGGLGRALAAGLRDAGARVAVCGRDPAKNAATAAAFGPDMPVIEMDVTDEGSVERGIARVTSELGRLDVLVNNAGNFRGGFALEEPLADWRSVIETHLTGAWLCARHAARAMVRQGTGGKIINISSVMSRFGANDFADYTAAKSGVEGLTRSLAVEWARFGIQVNAILPGYFDTDMSAGMPEWLRASIVAKTPGRRWGRPEELIGPVVFLASRASDWVTGACLPVDGGYLVQDRFYDPRLFGEDPTSGS